LPLPEGSHDAYSHNSDGAVYAAPSPGRLDTLTGQTGSDVASRGIWARSAPMPHGLPYFQTAEPSAPLISDFQPSAIWAVTLSGMGT
jgi:hypothetical protein